MPCLPKVTQLRARKLGKDSGLPMALLPCDNGASDRPASVVTSTCRDLQPQCVGGLHPLREPANRSTYGHVVVSELGVWPKLIPSRIAGDRTQALREV